MKNKIKTGIGLLGISGILFAAWTLSPFAISDQSPKIIPAIGKLPLHFEPGVSPSQALARGEGYRMQFTPDEVIMALNRPAQKPATVAMNFIGANPTPKLSFEEPLAGKSNYFIGNDPKKWRTDVRHYARVKYTGVYPGIDLVFYGNQRQLEYDWIVAPGANPGMIKMAYKGVARKSIDGEGNLVLHVDGGQVIQKKPLIYQENEGEKQIISGEFTVKAQGEVQFKVAAYDITKPLNIDPVLSYSTYLGAGDEDAATDVAIHSGDIYVTGWTSSGGFPTQNPYQGSYAGGMSDIFVTKINPTSGVVYSTFLGGTNMDAVNTADGINAVTIPTDLGPSIAVDAGGNAYIASFTYSLDFPVANPLPAPHSSGSSFITKLSPAGNTLVYSTLFGPPTANNSALPDTAITDIAIDSAGAAYITGTTNSTTLPTLNAVQPQAGGGDKDAFAGKINAAGNALVYLTYLGGSKNDFAMALTTDTSGSAYITGYTGSTDFPTQNALQGSPAGEFDIFMTKLSPSGNSFGYSTYLGGSASEEKARGVTVDSAGHAYITGTTNSDDFPCVNALQSTRSGGSDAFITKFSPSGNALIYSTYLGGSLWDHGGSIALDANKNAYVFGSTGSDNFPVLNELQDHSMQEDFSYRFDGFIVKLNFLGDTLLYSSYLGGNADDAGNLLTFSPTKTGIAVDGYGTAHVVGATNSSDFPTTPDAIQTNSDLIDGFVSKIRSSCTTAAPTAICQWYQCNEATGTWYAENMPQGTSCSDGNGCNGSETCNGNGSCLSGSPVTIDDGNPCTIDSCNSQTGLVLNAPLLVGTSCNDTNNCTTNDRCEQGITQNTRVCRGTLVPGANDNNPCTADSCNPMGVPNHAPLSGNYCSDNLFCNGAEVCQTGVCVPGTPPISPCCNDGTAKPNGTLCDDRNACTSCNGNALEAGSDCCKAGICLGLVRDGCDVPK